MSRGLQEEQGAEGKKLYGPEGSSRQSTKARNGIGDAEVKNIISCEKISDESVWGVKNGRTEFSEESEVKVGMNKDGSVLSPVDDVTE